MGRSISNRELIEDLELRLASAPSFSLKGGTLGNKYVRSCRSLTTIDEDNDVEMHSPQRLLLVIFPPVFKICSFWIPTHLSTEIFSQTVGLSPRSSSGWLCLGKGIWNCSSNWEVTHFFIFFLFSIVCDIPYRMCIFCIRLEDFQDALQRASPFENDVGCVAVVYLFAKFMLAKYFWLINGGLSRLLFQNFAVFKSHRKVYGW